MQLYSNVSQDVQFSTGTNLLGIEPNELLQWARRSTCGAKRIRELSNELVKYEILTRSYRPRTPCKVRRLRETWGSHSIAAEYSNMAKQPSRNIDPEDDGTTILVNVRNSCRRLTRTAFTLALFVREEVRPFDACSCVLWVRGKDVRPFDFMTSNRRIPVANTLGWSELCLVSSW